MGENPQPAVKETHLIYYDKSGSRIYRPLQRRTPSADSAPDNECQLCGAPGGYPYCNANCEAADKPDSDDDSNY